MLNTTGFPSFSQAGRLTIEDSDWGEGAAEENQQTDVWCDIVNDDAGFLGAKTNALCIADVSPCCL